MRCPNCGGEVMPDEVFCGHCGTRLTVEAPSPAPPTAPAKPGGPPIVPIVIGVAIVLVVVCLCVVVAGLAGLCALPGIVPDTSPVSQVMTSPRPTEPVLKATPTTVPGFTVVPKPATPQQPPEASATPERPPTEPPAPPPGDVPFRVVSYVQRTDALGNTAVEIMGELESTSDQEVDTGWYLVYVTLKDKDGNVIPTTKDLTTFVQRPIMQPGQKSCFRSFFNASDFGFDLAQVSQLEPEVRKAPSGHDAYTVEMTVSNVDRSGNTLTGDITNDTQYSTRSVFILVTLYDADGRVIGVHYGTRVGDEQMKPGGTMGFKYTITSSDAAKTQSFDVLVIAYKQL